jgi:proteasome lid subunit RPN8/RPN11
MSELHIAAEVTRQIRQHARSSMTTEVCGVLIGDLLPGSETDTTIHAAISAVNAAQAGTHVTFTQDAWEHIYKVKDAEYPDARIVGWYHSHPGFGVFLSEHDTFIQENFFSAPNQVAWVYDPHTDEEGCFGWVGGLTTRLTAITITDTATAVADTRELTSTAGTDPEEAEAVEPKKRTRTGPPPRWLRWAASISALLAMLLLGFALSHLFFPTPYPLVLPMNPVTGQPLLHDPKTGDPVYMDPQTKKFISVDPKTGHLTNIDPESLRNAQQPAPSDNPFRQQQPSAPVPPKETK